MRSKTPFLALLMLATFEAQGQHNFRLLHAFGSGTDGAGVYDSVTLDAHSNVYGTTAGGGPYKGGTVFRLTRRSTDHWHETILHNFGWQNDGAAPIGGVIFDSGGKLYGTTETGGGGYTYGTVYRLSPGTKGWTETVLHRFGRNDQAGSPWGNLVMDQQGNLYGTASSVFELSPDRKGWAETILHEFTGGKEDGLGPQAGPIRDAAGNLYGTTVYGGGSTECGTYGPGCGTVWELSPPAGDEGLGTQSWTEHILHRFGFPAHDGQAPAGGQLAMDRQGNLYGTTQSGGPRRAGTVFKLTRPSAPGGVWVETILHGFAEDQNGYLPTGGVTFDSAGNLYGTTGLGGAYGQGVVFKLSPRSDGSWKYTLLHTFTGADGSSPVANLTLGPDGKLYGTTSIDGPYGGGVVFQITP